MVEYILKPFDMADTIKRSLLFKVHIKNSCPAFCSRNDLSSLSLSRLPRESLRSVSSPVFGVHPTFVLPFTSAVSSTRRNRERESVWYNKLAIVVGRASRTEETTTMLKYYTLVILVSSAMLPQSAIHYSALLLYLLHIMKSTSLSLGMILSMNISSSIWYNHGDDITPREIFIHISWFYTNAMTLWGSMNGSLDSWSLLLECY